VWKQISKSHANTGGPFGVGIAGFPVEIAAGHIISFSGYIRTENITRGYAGLWWRIDGEKRGRRSVSTTWQWLLEGDREP